MKIGKGGLPPSLVIKTALSRLPLVVLPAMLVFLLEMIGRVSAGEAWKWFGENSNERTLNLWIAFSIVLLAAAMIGRIRVAVIFVFLGCCAVAFASGMKLNQTGAPLFLWEIIRTTETKDVAKALNPALTPTLLYISAIALAVIAALWPLLKLSRVRLGWRERAVYAVVSVFLLVSLYSGKPIPFQERVQIFTIGWDQASNYMRNGYLLSTIMGIDLVRVDRPKGTGQQQIRGLVRSIESRHAGIDQPAVAQGAHAQPGQAAQPSQAAQSGQTAQPAGRKPNVIVMLSESFWDPTLMKNVKFSEDPMPRFHQLMHDYTSGWMLSPQFGGGTANVEFEVLSGNSMRFLPGGNAIAYIEYMGHGVDSLASILSRQGYTATSFNPFYNWFFNSRNVYKNFGFSRFVSSEYFDPEYEGPYLADRQVMERVIQMTEQTKGPDFIFANTMENHGPYTDKFTFHPITVSGPIKDDSKNMLENYATGVQAFDKAFGELVDHYSKSGEPTIIVCFGDHLPTLGDDYGVYKDTGYLNGDSDPDALAKLHNTPFVVWSNYDTGPRESLHLSPGFLGPYVLHRAGLPGSYYTDFLYDLSRRIPVIPPKDHYGEYNVSEADLTDYRRLQDDILFGGRYGYMETGIRGHIVNDGFELGYGMPEIDKVLTTDDDSQLEVTGSRFTAECTVWLNGMKLNTSWAGPTKLTAKLPKPEKTGQHPLRGSVQVKLVDDKLTVIGLSNIVKLSEH